jgi:hypothetical protein
MKHYCQYHKIHEYGRPTSIQGNFMAVTEKRVTDQTYLGSVMWLVSGEKQGGGTAYLLEFAFIIDSIERLPDGRAVMRGSEGYMPSRPTPARLAVWLKTLKQRTQNFRNGLSLVPDEVVPEMASALGWRKFQNGAGPMSDRTSNLDPGHDEPASVFRSMKDGTPSADAGVDFGQVERNAPAATGAAGLSAEWRLVMEEVERATLKFPTWPTDPLHAVAILGEEFGELTKAVLQTVYEPHKVRDGELRTEAIQTAAMALRFLASLDRYEFGPCAQHVQSSGNTASAMDAGGQT